MYYITCRVSLYILIGIGIVIAFVWEVDMCVCSTPRLLKPVHIKQSLNNCPIAFQFVYMEFAIDITDRRVALVTKRACH